MRLPIFIFIALVAVGFAPSTRAAAAPITVVGSDLLGPGFATGVASFAKRANLDVKLNLTGSRAGLESLQAGQADLGLLVFGVKESPPGPPFVVRTIAYHTAIVVVPTSLTLKEISFRQLQAIFGENESAEYKRWFDLDVKDDWSSRSIIAVMSGGGAGLSYDLFRYTVLTTPKLRSTILIEEDGPAAIQRIGQKEGGIAIVPALPTSQKLLKALPVARGVRGDVAFGPTPENVHSGDYPLRLPLQIVVRADAVKRLLPLLRFLTSAEAVPLWEGAQLVPLPPQAREGQAYEFEAM
jgi:ABC-type phosphate transport system substrate-binding protein